MQRKRTQCNLSGTTCLHYVEGRDLKTHLSTPQSAQRKRNRRNRLARGPQAPVGGSASRSFAPPAVNLSHVNLHK
jgi:hypothetical protein